MTKNQYKKIAIFFFSLTLVLFLTEYAAVKTIGSIKTGTIGKINAVSEHVLDYPITIWGASTALMNFDSKLIGDSLNSPTFNMGIHGTNLHQYHGLLKEYLDYTKQGEIIIIALDIHGGLAKRESFYHIHNWLHLLSNDHIYNSLLDIDHSTIVKARYVPFYKLIMYDKHSFKSFKLALLNNSENYSFSKYGSAPALGTIKIDSSAGLHFFDAPIDEKVLLKLKDVCTAALEKGIQPIVVLTPVYKKGLAQITNSDKFESIIEEYVEPKTIIINMMDTYISENHKLFIDNTHLNVKGASEFSHALVKEILSHK